MILLVDNRDSFTFNLYQYLLELGWEVAVERASELSWDEVVRLNPAGVITGPGPGHPRDAHLSLELARKWPERGPLLGVCLGHQALALALGGTIRRCEHPWHGRSSDLCHDGSTPFEGLPECFPVGRYHSLTVEERDLPQELIVTARTSDGEIQALRHRDRPAFGVQFHPESILSEHGHGMLANFLQLCKRTGPG